MNIGILGCGHIAKKVVGMLVSLEGVEVVACAARSLEKAKEFAKELSIPHFYGSYEELVQDDNVELVYITTIHSLHLEHMLLCLEHGKNVICEKAFTINEKEARIVFDKAKEKNLFVCEAIWTRYQPARRMIDDLVGRIGKIQSIEACLGYNLMHKERVRRADMGGGALLDIGVYPINFVLMVQNKAEIVDVSSVCIKSEEDVDIRDEILFSFSDGSTAHMKCDAEADCKNDGIIQGSLGRVEVDNINNPTEVRLYLGNTNPVLVEKYEITHSFNGYEYEFLEAKRAIKEGRKECESMPWSETIRVMGLMDNLRSDWNVKLKNE
ncbi:MAG: Gfo/Idh/MocA family oxidoreductase [Sphaerochaetaceae bacterium]|nr:Gfo/Idh/MocA family oxidoreductase [Sphaerochaetaceae bacterium]